MASIEIGIIGYGHTGSAFAKKLRGFEAEVLVYDKYKKTQDDFVQQVSLDEIKRRCDVISFHVPYHEETHYYLNVDFIADCAKNPIFINTSRGAVVNTLDILDALENKKITGFCIDVFEDEPIHKNKIHPLEIYQKLIAKDNVIATPHIAGWTIESKYKLVKILMDKIEILANSHQ
ncbi:MAG TPA: NAD(P)-dependent oxidoreductase [Chitinophagales bacterium]|nr:NAD(P)-dependent oxidoreductase [Chitinophagales bacterium]